VGEANAVGASPNRLAPHDAAAFRTTTPIKHLVVLTCDQDHGYGDEQRAFDLGKMDEFVEFTNRDSCSGQPRCSASQAR
jgi:phospholipase C